MGRIQVSGGKPLVGETAIQGAKNAALPLMAAALLHKGTTVLHNCPDIADVSCMRLLLEDLGCQTEFRNHTMYIDASVIRKTEPDAELTARMRGSVLLMGSLLGRMGEVILPFPGGCVIGKRPVNYHLDMMRSLGAEVICQDNRMILRRKKLRGTQISMCFPSVGATENGILAATLADGITELKSVAREPEIGELCRFLQEKGAQIHLTEENIRITGVQCLRDSEYTLMPDRIVAGTYLLAAAATRGQICLHRVPLDHMKALLDLMRQTGVRLSAKEEETGWALSIDCRQSRPQMLQVETAPYPGFPTDLQSQLMAAVTAIPDMECYIRENLFEDRFVIAKELKKLGAEIEICQNEAYIRGIRRLNAANLKSRELRGGAALVLAALAAEGVSEIEPDDYIRRGYEHIDKDLRELGGEIRRFGG